MGAELRRIDATGTVWFAAAVLAAALPLATLLASGWRPDELPTALATTWWAGAALALLGILAFAWAGCPVLGTDPGSADRRKSLAIRIGVVVYLVGMSAAALALLLSPA